jgi:hypothetical protein
MSSKCLLINNIYYRVIHVNLWPIIAEVLAKYMRKVHKTNGNEYNFKTVKSVLSFPFQYTCPRNSDEVRAYF